MHTFFEFMLMIAASVFVGNSFYVQSAGGVDREPEPPAREIVDRLDAPVDPDNLPFQCDPIYKEVSPDGTKLAFAGRMYAAEDRFGLFVIELKTGVVHHLVKKALKTGIAWSPDSKHIAVANRGGYVVRYPLDIVNVETGEVTPTGILGHMPDWSPNGREIVCLVDRTRADGVPDGRVGVWNLESKSLRRISPAGFNVELRNGDRYVTGAYAPKWSPDSQQIAFLQYHRRDVDGEGETRRDAWVVNANGQNLRLASEDVKSRFIEWSADSQSLSIESPAATIDVNSLKVAPKSARPTLPEEAKREREAEQVARERVAQYDVDRILLVNKPWMKPDYTRLKSIQFTHRMSPIRLDERFSWRQDGSWSVEVIHREDEQAEAEIGRLLLTTSEGQQFTLPPKGRYPRQTKLEPLQAVQQRFGHLMGTRANFVATDWGRTPTLFNVVDVRPAEEPGQTVLELKLNYQTARRHRLNYGAMFHSTSWSYLHDLAVRRAELTVDNATGRILRETSHTNYGPTNITFADWIDHEGKSFPGSIRVTNDDQQFTVDYRFQVLPTGVWLLKSGESRFVGKEPQLEELGDVQINSESPDVARHLQRVRSGLAQLTQDAQTVDLEFESNLLRLGQRDMLNWIGTDPAASTLTSLEFTSRSTGQRFREVPAWPTLRARFRYDHPFPQMASANPLLFVLYDDAGQPVQTYALPIAAIDTLQRPAAEFLNRIRNSTRMWLDPDLGNLPKVGYTFHSSKEKQADYSIHQSGNVHFERGVTMTTALDSLVASPEKYRMPVHFSAKWNDRPVEVAVITGPRFGWVFGNGIEGGWTGGYTVSASDMATVVIDAETGRPLVERYGNIEVHFLDYVESRPKQFVPRRIVFKRVGSGARGIDFRFQIVDGRAWLLDRSIPGKPEYAVWIDNVTIDGQPPASTVRTTEPTDSPVEQMDWSRVTDRSVSDRASVFDHAMAEFVNFEASPQFLALGRTRIVEPGHVEFDIGRSSFLKHALSWTLSRATNDGIASATTASRVTRTAGSVSFHNGQRGVLNATAANSKTQLRSVEFSRNANVASAKIELISQDHYSEQYTAITAILFNSKGLPVATADLTSTYRVTQPVYQTNQLQLNFTDVPIPASNTLRAVFGIQTQTIGGPMGSQWGRYMSHEPVLPIPVLLSNSDPEVWTVGLTELFTHHRSDIVRGSQRRGDHRRHDLARDFAPYRDAFRHLFDNGKDANGLALLCRLAGHSGDRSFIRRIAPLLEHPAITVRDSAAVGLGLLEDGRASDRIRKVAASKPVENMIGHLNLTNDAISALDILGLTPEK